MQVGVIAAGHDRSRSFASAIALGESSGTRPFFRRRGGSQVRNRAFHRIAARKTSLSHNRRVHRNALSEWAE